MEQEKVEIEVTSPSGAYEALLKVEGSWERVYSDAPPCWNLDLLEVLRVCETGDDINLLDHTDQDNYNNWHTTIDDKWHWRGKAEQELDFCWNEAVDEYRIETRERP